MGFKAKQCKGISRKTGERCRQPALKAGDYCRFHMNKETGDNSSPETEISPGEKQKGAQSGNKNALKHGAYSLNLLPEELEIYEKKRDEFIGQLGKIDVFDAQVVHILSLISCKLDVAAGKGAPAEALIPISNEILKLLRSLKETRDSRDPEEEDAPKTMADFLEELAAMDAERGLSAKREDQRKRIYDLEKEVNKLRAKLKLPPRENIEHRIAHCDHCREKCRHRRNANGEWVCMKCGWVTKSLVATSDEKVATPAQTNQ